ncbi:TPA: TraK family protein [Legionella pneumophila]
MATSYTDQLAKWVKEKKATPRNKNLVAFLAVRADVKEAIDAGYPVKTVWENMHELKRVEFGYDTFLNYVNRHIRGSQETRKTSPIESNAAHTLKNNESKSLDDATKQTTKTAKPGALPGFTFNPVPNAEELF